MIYYKAVNISSCSVSAYSKWRCNYKIGEKTCKIKDSIGLFAFYSLGDLRDFYGYFDGIYLKGLGKKMQETEN